ncbi:DUF7312 domain-containing protein [Haloarcula japonica]|uniref:DUF7312 domain-containing protein n=1 Tax=Haloarcula japonica (strain ATCC 49778 / DSM 6131 / JCM 7785 / NBRC 101032 / NCIMB 13157 / TR-1) TaxID=1227453 RepID=M0LHW9_HALJT|nr:hypothetical protein [Haloarcula japonica]EMA33126.1 hypothetical protein C444_05026 [Haloarcula japonica DSM 6131]
MNDDGAAQDDAAATGDTFTEEYELATDADVIRIEDEPDSDAADEEGAVAGSFAPDLDVTPGVPKPENVVFVALGVCIAILAFGRMFLGAEIYAPMTLGGVVLAVAIGTAALYGFFVRTSDA